MENDWSCTMPDIGNIPIDHIMVVHQNVIVSVSKIKQLCSAPVFLMTYCDGILLRISDQVNEYNLCRSNA